MKDWAALRAELAALATRLPRRVQIMEVCGTHTVSIFRSGLRQLLPSNVHLVSGPGCPVCVTAQRHIDAALELAARHDVILATYGDMLRVPGARGSLERLRAQGARVQVVTSARAALALAQQQPQRQIVFLAVGFETTAPATAAVVLEAEQLGIDNFFVLPCHKLVMPALTALLDTGDVPLDGLLAPGHVSVIIGADAYLPLARDYGKPVVVTGFEPEQILRGIVQLLRQIAEGQAAVENVYATAVTGGGNHIAQQLLARVFVSADTAWRALGVIPQSGLELAPPYRRYDALRAFDVTVGEDVDHPACRCGEVITGRVEPPSCALFGTACTPLRPIGPCMVSSEGTCAAWFKYHRQTAATEVHA